MERTVWDRISRRLKETGKNQSWLADQLGIERAAVSNWKRRGVVPADQFAALAVLFGESIDWVAGTGDPRNTQAVALSAMAQRIAQDFDKLTTEGARLDAFARCISAISRASDSESQIP